MGWYIKPNHTTRTPSNLLFLDCETTPRPHPTVEGAEIHDFRLGCAIAVRMDRGEVESRRVFHFSKPTQLWRWIRTRLSIHRPLWVFAHNLGFDLTVSRFWDRLTNKEFVWADPRFVPGRKDKNGEPIKQRRGYCLADDPPTLLSCFADSGEKMVCCDTLNYWRCSLETLGEAVGCKKLPMPAFSDPDEEWRIYCENDCRVIETAIIDLMRFVRTNDLGCWKGTLPGLAYSAWRHRFMGCQVLVDQRDWATRIARAAYFGGENRCWFLGQVRGFTDEPLPPANPYHPCHKPIRRGPVYRLDLTAAYAWAMKQGNLPVKLRETSDELPVPTLNHLANRYPTAAIVEYADPVHSAPIRVSKGEFLQRGIGDGEAYNIPPATDSRAYYARGHFLTALCGDELVWALRNGSIKRCLAYSSYEAGDPFSAFVDYFWQLRKEAEAKGDKVREGFAKQLYTNLYGRFGMKGKVWTESNEGLSSSPWGYDYLVDTVTDKLRTFRSIGWLVQEKQEPGESSESFPIIPACITSRVRVRMRMLASIAGERECLYQATDSLHVTAEGYSKLRSAGFVRERELGYLHLQGVSELVEYRGAGNYTIDGDDRITGKKKSAITNSDGTYTQPEFEGLTGIGGRSPDSGITVRKVTRRIMTGWDGGSVALDGTVTPWTFLRLHPNKELSRCLGWEHRAQAIAGENQSD